MSAPAAAATPRAWRRLIAPGLAALVCFAILVGLGTWQVARKVEKEALIAAIAARSRQDPPAALPSFDAWNPKADEFRRVRVTGTLLDDRETLVHALVPGDVPGRPLQGYLVITPLRRDDGSIVLVNRGFVPTELRKRADRRAGESLGRTTITGILRGPEPRGMFVPAPDPARGEWFHRDIAGIAAAQGLGQAPETVAPYMVEADASPNPGGWPRGGQLRVDLPNNHLQYAFTWYGLAACLVAVFSAFAWRRLHEPAAQ